MGISLGICADQDGASGEEIRGGEFKAGEYVAGAICGILALLFGYAEIINGNQHLHVSDKLNDGEKSQGYKHCGSSQLLTHIHAAAQGVAKAGGYRATVFAAMS